MRSRSVVRSRYLAGVLFFLGVLAEPAHACDPCALYNASRLTGHSEDSYIVALSQQFTSYAVSDPTAANVESAELTRGYNTTQLTLGFDASDSLGFQLTLPFVYRAFDQIENFRETSEDESGIGDGVLSVSYSPIVVREPNRATILSFTLGLKLPTGDTGGLEDSVTENETTSARHPSSGMVAHHQIGQSTGLGGRILTIGTGSVDTILGVTLLSRWEKLLFLASLQYSVRTEGDFDYQFDNDVLWNAGPGLYLHTADDLTIAVRGVVSGEEKGKDTFEGQAVEGSSVSNVYMGPEILLTIQSAISLEIALDIPLYADDSEATITPDYRLRSGVSYRY